MDDSLKHIKNDWNEWVKEKKKEKPKYYEGRIFRNTKGCSLKYKIECFFEDIRRAWHRAKNGYCHCDVWDIDYWFKTTIPHMLGDLIENRTSYPGRYTDEEWDKILREMQCYFLMADEDYALSPKNPYEKAIQETYDKWTIDENGKLDMHRTPEEEELAIKWREEELRLNQYRTEQLQKGLKLFAEHIEDLWD